MKVLVIEDSQYLARYLSKALRLANYTVDIATDGEDGLWHALNHAYEFIILDIMIPKLDGFSLLEKLRKTNSRTRVICLTAKDKLDDKIKGLKLGADDYLVKPFEIQELLVRMEVLARRSSPLVSEQLSSGELRVDMGAKEAFYADNKLDLNRRELMLLSLLLRCKGQVVNREDIEQALYNADCSLMSNTINSSISILRKEIRKHTLQNIIMTKHGVGYWIKEPVS